MDHPPWIITPQELAEELAKAPAEQPRLLDVRETAEWLDSRIEGCKLVSLGEVTARIEKEFQDKQADIVVYCAHGVRSMHALRAMQMLGYTRLRSLMGGICAWEDEGRPVLRGSPR